MTEDFGHWRSLVHATPSKEGWEAICDALTDWAQRHPQGDQDFTQRTLPYLLEHTSRWPAELRPFQGRWRTATKNTALGLATKLKILLAGTHMADELTYLETHVEVLQSISTEFGHHAQQLVLSLFDGGENHDNWRAVLEEFDLETVEAAWVQQTFGGDCLGGVLHNPTMRALKHLKANVEGYESYCIMFGLNDEPIDKPHLQTLCFDYYALHPLAAKHLADARFPKLDTLYATLLAAGALEHLLEAKWFTNLHTLRVEFDEFPDDTGFDHDEWRLENIEGFLEDESVLKLGQTLLEYDLDLLLHHPNSVNLQRLMISSSSNSTIDAALFENNTLESLQVLHIDPDLIEDAEVFKAAIEHHLPNLKTLSISVRAKEKWSKLSLDPTTPRGPKISEIFDRPFIKWTPHQ